MDDLCGRSYVEKPSPCASPLRFYHQENCGLWNYAFGNAER